VKATLESLARFDDQALVDDDSFFAALAARIAEAVGAHKAVVLVLADGRLRARGAHGLTAEALAELDLPEPRDRESVGGRIVFGDFVFNGELPRSEESPEGREVIDRLGVRNAVAVGWRNSGVPLGSIAAFDSRRPGGFDADDVLVLQIAADISAFVYAQRLLRARTARILRLSDELSHVSDFESMARAMQGAVSEILPGIEAGIVEVPRGRPDSLRALAGPRMDIPSEVSREGTGVATVIESGAVLETDDLEAFSVHAAALRHAGFRRVRAIPLLAGRPLPDGRTALGAITFLSRRDRAFTAEERGLMDDLGRRLGVLMHRVELLKLEEEASAGLRAVVDATIDMGSSLEPASVIDRLLRRATVLLSASRATLASLDGADLVIEGSHAVEGTAFDVGRRFKYAMSPQFLRMLETRQPLHETYRVDELEADVRPMMSGIQQSITVPIVESERVSAVLTISRHSDRAFTGSETQLLQVISTAAGIALQNARLYQDAREASRAKTDFLNLAGHELRTPLAVIRGYLSLVSTGAYGDPPAEWRPLVAVLEAKAAELNAMVESILVAARLQSGRLQLAGDRVELANVVAGAVDRATAAAALTGGAVVARYLTDRAVVAGDPRQLAVIIDNLLANAIKYSPPPAAVTVTIQTTSDCAEVRVTDRGRGIPREHWDRVFDEFVRAVASDSEAPAGTGLGLYIARQLAQRYGGTLEIEWSEVGKGSSFVLRLPLARTG
jgi:signal transduction histidine kinase